MVITSEIITLTGDILGESEKSVETKHFLEQIQTYLRTEYSFQPIDLNNLSRDKPAGYLSMILNPVDVFLSGDIVPSKLTSCSQKRRYVFHHVAIGQFESPMSLDFYQLTVKNMDYDRVKQSLDMYIAKHNLTPPKTNVGRALKNLFSKLEDLIAATY